MRSERKSEAGLINKILIVYKLMNKGLRIIRITSETLEKIRILAEKKNLKMITVLEYLLKGKINIKEL